MNVDFRMIIYLGIALLFAFFFSYTTTPLVHKLAMRVKAIDIPKDERRMHNKPIPTMGGLAIYAAFFFGVLAFVPLFIEVWDMQYTGMLLGATIIVVTGMVDDIYNLKPIIKLLAQIAAALVICAAGIVIRDVSLPGIFGGGKLVLGDWAVPLTVLWIVVITNTINLIDGLDGLACGISAISSLALLVVSMFSVSPEFQVVMVLAALLAGACLGFLPYNLNPAKIFMGDTGAMFLGFILSVISIQGFFKVNAVVSFVVPFLVMGLPILDTLIAIIRRLIAKQPPFRPDRKHLHHKLIDLGLNQKQSVMLLYAVSAMFGMAAIIMALPEDKKYQSAGLILIISLGIGLLNWFVMKRERNREEAQMACEEQQNQEAQGSVTEQTDQSHGQSGDQ